MCFDTFYFRKEKGSTYKVYEMHNLEAQYIKTNNWMDSECFDSCLSLYNACEGNVFQGYDS